MFSQCYEEGKNRQGVTAEVFMRVADLRGMFSRSLRLSTLPVLEQHSPTPFNKVTPLALPLHTLPVLIHHVIHPIHAPY